MRWQTTVVIAILLAVVAGFFLYDVQYLEPAREKRESERQRLWTVEAKDVEEVTIKRAADTVRLARSGDAWKMLEPVAATGAKTAVDDVVAALVGARSEREVAASPAALREFGLDTPAADVTLKVKGRAEPLRLSLGGTNPTGAWAYARQPQAPAVFLVSEVLLRDTTKPASDFRDTTVLAFERKDVTAVDLALHDDTIHAEQAADGAWRITKPTALVADADTLLSFIDKLQFSRVKEFVAEAPRSLAPYGLDRPVRVGLTLGRGKDRATKSLLLGRVDTEKKGVYALRPGERSVLLLNEEIWTLLPKNVAVLRDKTVVAFDRDKLARIDLESPKGALTLERRGDEWRITKPESLPGDGPVIGGLVSELRDLKAQAFLPTVRFKPAVRVSLWESGASAPKVVAIAASSERRGGQPSAYASSGTSGTVLVDGRVLGDLSKSVMDLRDHMFYASLHQRDVKRVRVSRGGKTALFERLGETGWRMLEPKPGAANGPKVEDMVTTVTALRWNDIVADGADLAKYGLDRPSLEIALMNGEGVEVARVAIGRQEGRQAYVRGTGPTVYTVDMTRIGAIPKVPDDFKG